MYLTSVCFKMENSFKVLRPSKPRSFSINYGLCKCPTQKVEYKYKIAFACAALMLNLYTQTDHLSRRNTQASSSEHAEELCT